MKKILPLLIVCLIIVLWSCKKEDTTPSTFQFPNSVYDSPGVHHPDTPVLLTRLLVLDTTSAAPNDTVAIYEIHYDASNRPSSLKFLSYSYATTPSYISLMNYEYQGADTLAS
jgi:hypothetical protein